MKRLPNGVDAPFFYQHRAPERAAAGRPQRELPDDDVPTRLIGGSLKTLLYMAQLASISMDPWFSTMDDLDSADQVAIDLDPQPGATFAQILDVARWVQEELDRVNVAGLSRRPPGSEGLHIFIPLPKGTPYQAGMLFCQIIATMVAAKHPKVATVERTVRKRKDKTIYVDYLQNIQGKTLACAYSARASAFAGVSTPLTWKEVHDSPAPQDFTIDTIAARLEQTGDLWAKLLRAQGRQPAGGDREAQQMTVTGIVLAGGRSTRMGHDKASLPFGGETMIARAVRIVRRGGRRGDRRRTRPGTPSRGCRDGSSTIAIEDLGPLAGIAAGLAASHDRSQPRSSPATCRSSGRRCLRRLIELRGEADICVAVADGHASPLVRRLSRARWAPSRRELLAVGRAPRDGAARSGTNETGRRRGVPRPRPAISRASSAAIRPSEFAAGRH